MAAKIRTLSTTPVEGHDVTLCAIVAEFEQVFPTHQHDWTSEWSDRQGRGIYATMAHECTTEKEFSVLLEFATQNRCLDADQGQTRSCQDRTRNHGGEDHPRCTLREKECKVFKRVVDHHAPGYGSLAKLSSRTLLAVMEEVGKDL